MTGQADMGAALDEVVAELTRLEAAATPGPWIEYPVTTMAGSPYTTSVADSENSQITAAMRDPDAALIAAMRNHLPALLAALAKVEALADAWTVEANNPDGHSLLVQTYRNHACALFAALRGTP